jgi:hypothetical protein
MKDFNQWLQQKPGEHQVPAPKDFAQIASALCENALKDAKEQLHPLLRDAQLDRLDERPEFVKTFKRALEQRIARKLAAWQPGIRVSKLFSSSMRRGRKNPDPGMVPFICLPRCLACPRQ